MIKQVKKMRQGKQDERTEDDDDSDEQLPQLTLQLQLSKPSLTQPWYIYPLTVNIIYVPPCYYRFHNLSVITINISII